MAGLLLAALACTAKAADEPPPGSPASVLAQLLASAMDRALPSDEFFSRVFSTSALCRPPAGTRGLPDSVAGGACELASGPYRYRVQWGYMDEVFGEHLERVEELHIMVHYLSGAPEPLQAMYRQVPSSFKKAPLLDMGHGPVRRAPYRSACGTHESATLGEKGDHELTLGLGALLRGKRCTGTLERFGVTFQHPAPWFERR